MYCSECGSALGVSDKFCSKCGAAIPATHQQPVQETPPPITPAVKLTTVTSISTAFRDPTQLTRWLRYFLYASIAIDAIAVFSGVMQYQLLSDFKLGIYSSEALATAAAESNDQRQKVIGLFQAGVAITTIILFAMWIYRANFNARSLGAQKMKFTPGWSVGYYFIPFLNLWRPYQAMKEIWKASKTPHHGRAKSAARYYLGGGSSSSSLACLGTHHSEHPWVLKRFMNILPQQELRLPLT